MEREDYEELYTKEPQEIINYVSKDMLRVIGYSEIDDNVRDKLTEWRYILMKAEQQIYNCFKIPKDLI